LAFSVYYRFAEVMQRIFIYGDIHNSILLLIKSSTFWYIKRFLRHHTQELYTFEVGPVFSAHPVGQNQNRNKVPIWRLFILEKTEIVIARPLFRM